MRHSARSSGGSAAKRGMTVVLGLCAAALLLAPMPDAAEAQWTEAELAALFPGALDGWAGDDVEIQELKTVTSDLEDQTGGITGSDAGVSVRLRLTRNYTAEDKSVLLIMDSADIETAGMVEAAWTDPDLRRQLEEQGITAREFGTYQRFDIVAPRQWGTIVRIGQVGIVALECVHDSCARDIERIVGLLDLTAIARFVAFDHRRPGPATTE